MQSKYDDIFNEFLKKENDINKIGKDYDLNIMDKDVLRDLGKLNEFFHRHNLLKLIFD